MTTTSIRARKGTGGAGAVAAAVALVLITLLLPACSFGTESSSAGSTTSVALAPSTTEAPAPTTTALEIITIPGSPRTTTSIATTLGPGVAQITGTVVGPAGPVRGATVQIERGAGGNVISTRVVTGSGGGFVLPSILGGAYRVRAWASPDLAQPDAEEFFLGAQETKNVQLSLASFGSVRVRVTADADPLPVGSTFNVTILVFSGSINTEGELVAAPISSALLTFDAGSRLAVQGSDRGVANANGEATFRVQCRDEGESGGEVVASGNRFPLGLPPCAGSAG